MDEKKIAEILGIINKYLIPLAEKGAATTDNEIDNIIVEGLKGGLPAVEAYFRSKANANGTD